MQNNIYLDNGIFGNDKKLSLIADSRVLESHSHAKKMVESLFWM